MACINPNTPEFKKALKEVNGNPLLAELIVERTYMSSDQFDDPYTQNWTEEQLMERLLEDEQERAIYRQKAEREAPAIAAALKRMRAEENDTGLTEEELEEKLMEAAMEDEEERAYQRWKDKVWEQRNVANDTGLTKEELEDKLMEVRAEEKEERRSNRTIDELSEKEYEAMVKRELEGWTEEKLRERWYEEKEEEEYYRLKAERELPILREVREKLGLFNNFDESDKQLRKQEREDEKRENEEDNNCSNSPFLD
jgi:DNA-binding phage protein